MQHIINGGDSMWGRMYIVIIIAVIILAGCESNTGSNIQKWEGEANLPTMMESQQVTCLEEKIEVEVSNNSIVKIKIDSQNEYEKLR